MAQFRYDFPTKPRANASATVTGKYYRFTVLTDGLLRYEYCPMGHFEDRASTLAIHRAFPVPSFRHTTNSDGRVEIRTARFHLVYDGRPFSPSSLYAHISGGFNDWRYGDDGDGLGGTARTLDQVEGRLPLGPGVVSRGGVATLDDSDSMLFDEHGWIAGRREGEGRVDGYLFAYGHDYKAAIKAFYALSGKQPLVPRWMLGNWWSRYHAYSADEYIHLMDKFQRESIPLSVAVIDMDWHWVQEDFVQQAGRSGWTGYSWNRKLFPDPKAFMKALHDRGLKTTLNDHPADGIASYEDMYEEVAKAMDHDTSNKDPIDFNITSRNFVDAFFDIVTRGMEDTGCDFIWVDWQQGPYSEIAGIDPLWPLNHFHFLDNKAKNPDTPIIFSRYAGPGSHRYPVGFSGDTVVSWASLAFQPEFTATASNIGYGWWSHDIGGHMSGRRDDELTARWVQLGVFSPLMRLHSTANRWNSKEPWLYDLESFAAIKKVMRLRHRLVPYLYSMAVRATEDDEPVVQPLYWAWPEADEAYQFRNTFFFGSEMLVAPVTQPRSPLTRLGAVQTWLPPGRWVDTFTGVVYQGDRVITFHRKLEDIPALGKEGAIIPLDGGKFETHGTPRPDRFDILIVPGADGLLDLVEHGDDGAADVRTRIRFDHAAGTLEVKSASQASLHDRGWRLHFLAVDLSRNKVEIEGAEPPRDAKTVVRTYNGTSITLGMGAQTNQITVKLGPVPPLQTQNFEEKLEKFLEGAQIPFEHKDRIWNAVKSDRPGGIKVSQVEAIGLDEAVRGAVMELLQADPA